MSSSLLRLRKGKIQLCAGNDDGGWNDKDVIHRKRNVSHLRRAKLDAVRLLKWDSRRVYWLQRPETTRPLTTPECSQNSCRRNSGEERKSITK